MKIVEDIGFYKIENPIVWMTLDELKELAEKVNGVIGRVETMTKPDLKKVIRAALVLKNTINQSFSITDLMFGNYDDLYDFVIRYKHSKEVVYIRVSGEVHGSGPRITQTYYENDQKPPPPPQFVNQILNKFSELYDAWNVYL
jgi:hypothetical protein